jgi:hypothetical protein
MSTGSPPVSLDSLAVAADGAGLDGTVREDIALEFDDKSHTVRVRVYPPVERYAETDTLLDSLPRFLRPDDHDRIAVLPAGTEVVLARRDAGRLETYRKRIDRQHMDAGTIALVGDLLGSSSIPEDLDETPAATLYGIITDAVGSDTLSEEFHIKDYNGFHGHSSEGATFYAAIASWVLVDDPETVADVSGNRTGLLAAVAANAAGADVEFTALTTGDEHEADEGDDTDPERALTTCLTALEYPAYLTAERDTLPFTAFAAELAAAAETPVSQSRLVEPDPDDGDGGTARSSTGPLQDAIVGGLLESPSRRGARTPLTDSIQQVVNLPNRLDPRLGGAVAGLKPGGRGALIIPMNLLTNKANALDVLKDTAEIHAIIEPTNELLTAASIHSSFQACLVLFTRTDAVADDHDIRHIQVDEYDSKVGDLLHVPDERVVKTDVADRSIRVVMVSQRDLIDCPTGVLLENPDYAPLFRSDEFTTLGGDNGEESLVDVYRDFHQIDRDALYFSESEREKSQISREFFTPIIRYDDIGEEQLVLTDEDLSHAILDPRPILDAAGIDGGPPSTDDVIVGLRAANHHPAAEYLERHSESITRLLKRGDGDSDGRTPDFVLRQFSPDTKWRRTRVSEAVVGDRCLGVTVRDDPTATALHRILNTEGYQRFTASFFDPIGAGTVRYLIYEIRQIPVPQQALTPEFVTETDDYFPPRSRQDQVSFVEQLVDTVSAPSKEHQQFEQLFDANDEFAWAWFLSVEDYRRFLKLWKSDEQEAKSFVVERVSEEDIAAVSESLSAEPISEERAETIRAGIERYLAGHYLAALYTMIPQFEGVIADWAQAQGYEKTKADGQFALVIREPKGDEGDRIRKSLSALIAQFIGGGFGQFLSNNINDLRNNVTHGELVGDIHGRATICLLALSALCQGTLLSNGQTKLTNAGGGQ